METIVQRRGYSGGVRRLIADMNPTLRGFLIIALVAGVIVVLQLYQTLVALSILARIAFLLAVAFFVYLVWRERREEISRVVDAREDGVLRRRDPHRRRHRRVRSPAPPASTRSPSCSCWPSARTPCGTWRQEHTYS